MSDANIGVLLSIVMVVAIAISAIAIHVIDKIDNEENQSRRRQATLERFWRDEMRRIHPTPANPRATITKTPPPFERVSTIQENEVWR